MPTESSIKLLDVVALTLDVPGKGLSCGQVGTVVEMLGRNMFEIEFCDDWGQPYAQCAFGGSKLMVLHFEPVH